MRLFSRQKRQNRDAALALYARIVDQARNPEFYRSYGVPDTMEGRFELIVIHLFAVSQRLVRGEDANRALAQALSEEFVTDIDDTLREVGTRDVSVGRKVKSLYSVYGGRVVEYEAALAKDGNEDGELLARLLDRNIFDPAGGSPVSAARLSGYLRRLVDLLKVTSLKALEESSFQFPDPAAHEGGPK